MRSITKKETKDNMEKRIYYMGNERGTHCFTVADGKVVGTDPLVTEHDLLEFLITAEKLNSKTGRI